MIKKELIKEFQQAWNLDDTFEKIVLSLMVGAKVNVANFGLLSKDCIFALSLLLADVPIILSEQINIVKLSEVEFPVENLLTSYERGYIQLRKDKSSGDNDGGEFNTIQQYIKKKYSKMLKEFDRLYKLNKSHGVRPPMPHYIKDNRVSFPSENDVIYASYDILNLIIDYELGFVKALDCQSINRGIPKDTQKPIFNGIYDIESAILFSYKQNEIIKTVPYLEYTNTTNIYKSFLKIFVEIIKDDAVFMVSGTSLYSRKVLYDNSNIDLLSMTIVNAKIWTKFGFVDNPIISSYCK